MANVDETTPGFNLPVPSYESNTQDYDVPRLAAALYLIDEVLSSLQSAIGGKAAAAHSHEIAQVVGLAEALAGKMAASWRPTLDELVDVDVSAGANGQFLKKVGSLWIAAGLQLGDVTGWQDTVIALINSAISNVVGGSPAALDTLNELAAALGDDPAFATTVSNALGNRLRFDGSQSLNAGQKAQALGNLGVSSLIQLLLDDTTETQALTTLGIGGGLRAVRALATPAEVFGDLKQTATTTTTGVVRKATSAELTAGTADRYPDAALLKTALDDARPSAMVNFDGANPPIIRSQRNVASVTRLGSGNYRVNFTTPLASASYIVSSAVSNPGASQVAAAMITEKTAAALTIQCVSVNSALNAAFNPDTVDIIIFEA